MFYNIHFYVILLFSCNVNSRTANKTSSYILRWKSASNIYAIRYYLSNIYFLLNIFVWVYILNDDSCDGRPESELLTGQGDEYAGEISSLDNKTVEFRVVRYMVYFVGKLGYTPNDSFRTMCHVVAANAVGTTFYIIAYVTIKEFLWCLLF